ncbi:MAG: hypothetical protein ACFFFB_00420 [Candidatus Heimdallarchaeota archaeon]
MGKKKKKEKVKEEDTVSSYTLDTALKSSKKTETALQDLLKAFSEDTGYIAPKEEEKKIEPQLSYEAKKKIAEDYMMEEVPLSERGQTKDRTTVTEKEKSVEKPVESVKEEKEVISSVKELTKKSSISKKDSIYFKLAQFFEDFFQGYNERYEMWENSVSAILAILRKMRKITKKNTEDLVSSINKLHEKIQFNLEQFKIKRDEVEKLADVDIESMSSEFKKVLGLLELQIKEYQLKRLADEYVHQQRIL